MYHIHTLLDATILLFVKLFSRYFIITEMFVDDGTNTLNYY